MDRIMRRYPWTVRDVDDIYRGSFDNVERAEAFAKQILDSVCGRTSATITNLDTGDKRTVRIPAKCRKQSS